MPKSDLITGLDVGSGQVVAVVAEQAPDADVPEIRGAARQPCAGLKGGVVINIDETARAVEALIAKGLADREREDRGLEPGLERLVTRLSRLIAG